MVDQAMMVPLAPMVQAQMLALQEMQDKKAL
jgi:hypothetical protein